MSTMPINLEERRRRRSTNPLTAISYQLEQVIEDFELDTCVIATLDGLLLAKSALEDSEDAEYYAAYSSSFFSPILAEGDDNATISLSEDVFLHMEAVTIFGQTMVLASIGHDASMTHLSTYRALAGIGRITKEQQTRDSLAA